MEQQVALEKKAEELKAKKIAEEKQLALIEEERLIKIEEEKKLSELKIAELKRIEEKKKNLHIKTPDGVKSLYFTAYAI
jgi:hypothetical protein